MTQNLTQKDREKISRRNYILMISEGAIYWMATAFVEPTTVVAVFINDFTGSVQLAALSTTVMQAGMIIGTVFFGMYIHKVSDYGKFFRKWAVPLRMMYWLALPPLLLGVGGEIMVLIFLITQSIFYFFNGFISLTWQALNANTIESRDRGPIQGYQQFFSAIVGMLSAALIKVLMDSPLVPNLRYGLIFGICALLFTVNGFMLKFLRDVPHEDTPSPHRSFGSYLGSFIPMWKDSKPFRHIMYGRILYTGAAMATSLSLLFGVREMGLTTMQSSTMIYVQVAGQLAGGLIWGNLNRHIGNSRTMLLSNIPHIVIAAAGIVLLAFPVRLASFWVVAVMVFLGGAQGVAVMGFMNSLFDKVPRTLLPRYMVLQQLILLPFTAMPYLAGLLAQVAGFMPLYALVVLFGVGGTVYCTFYMRGERGMQGGGAKGDAA